MPCYQIDGVTPVVDAKSFVHPMATLIGDVIIAAGCYIGPGAVLRGDFGRLILHEGVNVQDTCVLHSFPDSETVIEKNGHIGHGAVLHGCRIGENALIGINAVIMDGVEVGESAIVAAMSFVKANMKVAPRSLVAGTPAREIRLLSDQEIDWKRQGTRDYQRLSQRCFESMRAVEPLTEPEADRPQLELADSLPLYKIKKDGDRD